MTYQQFLEKRIFPSLDGLRAISIFAVIWSHSGARFYPAIQILAHKGPLGVDMFFCLSGFLITTLILRERLRTGNFSLRQFWIRRALRIFPLYFMLLFICSVALYFVPTGDPGRAAFFHELPYYLTYTANWHSLQTILAISWSLSAEEQFYLFWPLVERYLPSLVIILLPVTLLINALLSIGCFDSALEESLQLNLTGLPMLEVTFFPICLGVLLAHLFHLKRTYDWAARLSALPLLRPLLIVCLLIVISLSPSRRGVLRLTAQLLMALLLGSCVIEQRRFFDRFLSHPWLRRIGAISYGMYLFHVITAVALSASLSATVFFAPLPFFLLTLAATIAMAEVSYRYYERRFLELKERFAT